MANSGTVTAGSAALASQYNNLRDDVLNITTGHTHTGASENGAKVAATGVSSGTALVSTVLTADGSGGASFQALAAAGADFQEFTSSGSWVKPAGKTAVYVFALGAGGGGAGGGRSSGGYGRGGGGGYGGAHSARWMAASTLAGTVTVTIGAGGAGGTALSSGTNSLEGVSGSDGGNTTFGTVILALGGPTGQRYVGNDFRVPVGITEWGQCNTDGAPGTAGTTDAHSTAVVDVSSSSYANQSLSGGWGKNAPTASTRTFTRSAAGGSGGMAFAGATVLADIYGGAAGARGFGANGTIAIGGNVALNSGTATNGSAGSVVGIGLGHGGGGGGAATSAVPGNGGAGYLGGGGGGGGGVGVPSGSAARASGAGGTGGAGYILVVSV